MKTVGRLTTKSGFSCAIIWPDDQDGEPILEGCTADEFDDEMKRQLVFNNYGIIIDHVSVEPIDFEDTSKGVSVVFDD